MSLNPLGGWQPLYRLTVITVFIVITGLIYRSLSFFPVLIIGDA